MGKVTYLVGTIGAAMFMILSLAGCNKTHYTIIVQAPTSVYEDYPTDGPPTSKIIAILDRGETVEIIHTRYAKDAQY